MGVSLECPLPLLLGTSWGRNSCTPEAEGHAQAGWQVCVSGSLAEQQESGGHGSLVALCSRVGDHLPPGSPSAGLAAAPPWHP